MVLKSTAHTLGCSRILVRKIFSMHPQWFQTSILGMDIATTRLKRPRGRFSENHMKKNKIMGEGRDGVTNTSFFSIQGVKTIQCPYKKKKTIKV